MADLFISYRNTPERRALVKRLSLVLRVHGLSAWWDHGLEGGEPFEQRIKAEIESATLVVPVWCAESVSSDWVIKEAAWGEGKLFPVRVQDVRPPPPFSHVHSHDLIGWNGDVKCTKLNQLVGSLLRRLGYGLSTSAEMLEELALLPTFAPLPKVDEEFSRWLSVVKTLLVERWGIHALEISRDTPLMTELDEYLGSIADSLSEALEERPDAPSELEDALSDFNQFTEDSTVGDLVLHIIRCDRRRWIA